MKTTNIKAHRRYNNDYILFYNIGTDGDGRKYGWTNLEVVLVGTYFFDN